MYQFGVGALLCVEIGVSCGLLVNANNLATSALTVTAGVIVSVVLDLSYVLIAHQRPVQDCQDDDIDLLLIAGVHRLRPPTRRPKDGEMEK